MGRRGRGGVRRGGVAFNDPFKDEEIIMSFLRMLALYFSAQIINY